MKGELECIDWGLCNMFYQWLLASKQGNVERVGMCGANEKVISQCFASWRGMYYDQLNMFSLRGGGYEFCRT